MKSETSSYPSTARVALAVFVWLACTAWMRPLLLPDEGRYIGVAWEMLRSGDWLTPTLDGLPFFHKPPLFYWVTAAALGIFGPNEWAGRMAPLLGATLAAVAGYRFLVRWAPATAPRMLVVLLTQPLFFFSAQYANLDMLVAGCITASTLALGDAVLRLEAGQPHRRVLLAAWGFAALGVLAKGLIGFVLPGGVVFVWLLATGRWRRLPALFWWAGLLLFAAVAAPWFVAMHLRFAEFSHYFFVVQHFERFSAQGFNNALPFWFYPVVLLLTMLPWTLWLPALRRRSAWTGDAGRLAIFMAVSFGLVLLFFSLPKSKLVGYILPAVLPLACLIAAVADPAAGGPRRVLLWRVSMVLGVLACFGSVALVLLRAPESNRALGKALLAQRQAGEPVLAVGRYPYDLRFYARLDAPVPVFAAWDRPAEQASDDWQAEFADAARFARDAGAGVLRPLVAFGPQLCAVPVTWVVGPRALSGIFTPLGASQAVATAGDRALWRVDRGAAVAAGLDCGAPAPEAK